MSLITPLKQKTQLTFNIKHSPVDTQLTFNITRSPVDTQLTFNITRSPVDTQLDSPAPAFSYCALYKHMP